MSALDFEFISSLLADPTQLLSVPDISPMMIGDENLRAVYDVVLQKQGRVSVSIIHDTLNKTAKGKKILQEISPDPNDTEGGVQNLFRSGITAGRADVLADEIRNNFLYKQIQNAMATIRAENFHSTAEWAHALSTAIGDSAAKVGIHKSQGTLAAGIEEALDDWEFRLDHPDKVTGHRFNLGKYDTLTGGVRTGDFIIFGAHSNEGKSQILIHSALEAATTKHDVTGKPATVAFFSLEMNARQISQRFMAKLGKVDFRDIHASQADRQRARETGKLIRELENQRRLIVIEPHMVSTLSQIERSLISLKQNDGLDIAFVDYAQLINVGGESKYAEVATISKRLKAMCLQLDIAIVAAAQLNREGLRETKSARPRLYHIADGMDLVRSADYVHMVWTPARHLAGNIGYWGGKAVLLTEKVRSGPAMAPLYFHADFNHSNFKPVDDATEDLLNTPEQQAIINATKEVKKSGTP